MLTTLQSLFSQLAGAPRTQTPASRDQALHMAAAVLLAEVMRADPAVSAGEREAATAALERRFALGHADLATLLEQAQAEASRANDFFSFTSRINDAFTQPDKIALVESMWHVAYADGVLDVNESHVIRKVAGLLHVTQGEYIGAKMRAKEAAGQA